MQDDSNKVLIKRFEFELLRQTEGSIEVTVSYSIPETINALHVVLPVSIVVRGTRGFDQTGGSDFTWDGETIDPEVTFKTQVDDDSTRFGGYSFADRGNWAITQKSSVSERWETAGTSVTVTEQLQNDPQVAASHDGYIVYIGPYEELAVRGAQQRIRLVVPEAAELSPHEHAVRQSLKYGSEDLVIGSRHDEVVAVAAPTDGTDWGIAGLQSGNAGFWARDRQDIDTPHNTWLHEYVHTRQSLNCTTTTRWLVEGSANYFAALLAYTQGLATYDEFHRVVSTSVDEHAVLAEPSSWPSPFTDYKKGCRVLAALDAKIREETDGKTLQSAFWTLNRSDEQLTLPEFKSVVADIAGEPLREWVDVHTRTTAAPEVAHDSTRFDRNRVVPIEGVQPVCPVCDSEDTASFCTDCGTRLDSHCPQCGLPVAGSEDRCTACGTAL